MTLLDSILPDQRFSSAVSVLVDASPRSIFRAFREVTLDEMPLARVLGELRYLPGRVLGRRRPAAPTIPFFEQLLAGGDVVLAELPDHEIVLGCVGRFHRLVDQAIVPLRDADAFAAFAEPGHQKLAMSLRVEPGPAGTRLSLEHRTHALDDGAQRAFARYWLAIGPMGDFVSWLLLRAIKRHAEARSTDARVINAR